MIDMAGMAAGLLHVVRILTRVPLALFNSVYVVFPFVVWTWLLWPIHYIKPDLYWRLEGYLSRSLFAVVTSWMWLSGCKVAEAGDDVSKCTEDESLVMFNHQSTGDVPVVMALVQNKTQAGGHLMWIMDRILMYTPFGVACVQRRDFFIQQRSSDRDGELIRLDQHIKTVYPANHKKWIILFPEGGFLRKRRAASQRYAKKNGYPVLEHVTLPRIGAMQVIMKQLLPKASNEPNSHITKGGSSLKWIIDATVGYRTQPIIDLFSVVHGGVTPSTTTVYYRVYRADQVPTDTQGLTKWVYDRYTEKEKLLEAFYRDGKFPDSDTELKEAKTVEYDAMWFLGLHIFYLASSGLHCYMISTIWSQAAAALALLL